MFSSSASQGIRRKPGLVAIAIVLLCIGTTVSFHELLSHQRLTVAFGLPASLLLVSAAMLVAAFAWRKPRAKLIVVCCVLVLIVGRAAVYYEQLSVNEWQEPDNYALSLGLQKLVSLHARLGKPQSGDWLTRHQECGQTYGQYLDCHPVRVDGQRRVIYIQPLGEFTATERKILGLTAEFMGIYYQLPVRVREDLPLSTIPDRARRTSPKTGALQLLTSYVLGDVLKPKMPEDAAGMIALTTCDLWPGEGWNFVFGQGSPSGRVAVWSLCRLGDPEQSEDAFGETLRRTLKVATHEMGHIFSIMHCVFYECNMCGSNGIEESDRHPLWLCPQCLAKLCHATDADPGKRFAELTAFAHDHGLAEEEAFWKKSLSVINPSFDRSTAETQLPADGFWRFWRSLVPAEPQERRL